MATNKSERPLVVYGAIASNLIVAIAKFGAASLTGSSSMLSEGIHSTVDTGNECLLLLGTHLSKRPADEEHPFGYGQELYFWSLIVAIVLFGVGGGMSIFEGVAHILHPEQLENPLWNYIVIGIGVVTEGTSWTIALRQFMAKQGDRSVWRGIRASKDPTVITVLLEDTAALTGLTIAFFGVWLSHVYQQPALDGVASILIGLTLASVAALLTYESRGLLIGESADKDVIKSIQQLTISDDAVDNARTPLTMQLGPNDVLLNLEIQFREDLSAAAVAAAVDRLEAAIQTNHADITRIFIEADAFSEQANR